MESEGANFTLKSKIEPNKSFNFIYNLSLLSMEFKIVTVLLFFL